MTVAAAIPALGRRMAAIALLAAFLGGAYAAIAAPLVAGYSRGLETAAQLQSTLSRLRMAADRLPELQQRLAALERRRSARSIYLEGSNGTLAAAGLQERIKSLIQPLGGELRSVQVLPPRVENKLRLVAVRCQFIADLPVLHQILYAIEAGAPALSVDNVEIRAVSRDRGDAQQVDAPRLDVALDVVGLMRGDQ